MWPETLNKERREKQEQVFQLEEIAKEMKNHFLGDYPRSDWIIYHFPKRILFRTGTEFLICVCYCEYCEHYIGITPIARRKNNVSVICGFCTLCNQGVAHNYRCTFLELKKKYKTLLKKKLNNLPDFNEEEWYSYRNKSVGAVAIDPDDVGFDY
jgi:hypothetical protein